MYHKKTGCQKIISRIARTIGSAVWPRGCAVCGEPLKRYENTVCTQCFADMPFYGAPRQLALAGAENPVIWHLSLMHYDKAHPSHKLFHMLKYRNRPALARTMGQWLGVEMKSTGLLDLSPVDVLVPVPLHWSRLVSRSYNQAKQVALGIRDITGIPIADALECRHAHNSQTLNSGDSRRREISSMYGIRRPRLIAGQRVALVDDIFTTGSTLFGIADIMKDSPVPPATLSFLTLGHTRFE